MIHAKKKLVLCHKKCVDKTTNTCVAVKICIFLCSQILLKNKRSHLRYGVTLVQLIRLTLGDTKPPNFLPVQQPRPQPICGGTAGPKGPTSHQLTDQAACSKAQLGGSLFHPEWLFVPRCRPVLEGNVISHRLNGPNEGSHTHTGWRFVSISERAI